MLGSQVSCALIMVYPPMPPSEPCHVFISYAHKDGGELAARLARALKARGYDTWLDYRRLHGGASWSVEIEHAIDRSDIVLALLSEASFRSDVCRGEQLRALRSDKCVIPVLVHSGADRPIYLESRQYLDFSTTQDYGKALRQLLSDITRRKSATLPTHYRKTDYETVPPLPLNYLVRSEVMLPLRNALLGDDTSRQVSVTGVRGMAGIGKTVLAQALCRRDEVVQAAFPDGIAWVTIGRRPGNLVAQMRDIAKALGESSAGFDTPDESMRKLRAMLRDKAALLVLDNVWDARHVEPFRAEAPRCRVLFTTRDARVASTLGAFEYQLDVLSPQAAREWLARYAWMQAESLPRQANDVVTECGRLPLALAMVGALLRGKPDLWNNILVRLRTAKVPELLKPIQVSVDALERNTQKRYYDLAVSPEDVPLAAGPLQVLWRCDQTVAENVIYRLVDASLATRDTEGRLSLHNLQHDFLRKRLGRARVMALNRRFLDDYKKHCRSGWPSGPNDGYFFEHLAWHLGGAGKRSELMKLLQDFDWILTKIKHTSANALIEDYDCLPVSSNLRILQSAIRLSTHVTSVDPDQLASQLVGRLNGCPSVEVERALVNVVSRAKRPWLRPLTASLPGPGQALIRTLHVDNDYVNHVALSNDGRWAVSASGRTVTAWNLETGNSIGMLDGDNVALSGDGRIAVSVSPMPTRAAKGMLKVWELESGRTLYTLRGHHNFIGAVGINVDGRRIVSASRDGKLNVWDSGSGRKPRTLDGHSGEVHCVAVSTDGSRAVSASEDKTVKVWDLTTGIILHKLLGHRGAVYSVAITPDARRALSASEDTTLKMWDVENGRLLKTLHGHTDTVWSVAVGKRLAISGSFDSTMRVWDLESGRELTHRRVNAGAVAITPDDRMAVTGTSDQTVQVWDVNRLVAASHHERQVELAHKGYIRAVAVSAERRRAISASDDATLKIWDLATFGVQTLRGHAGSILDVAMSEDGRRAVSAGPEPMLFVWDLDTGRRIGTLGKNSVAFSGVAISRDGRRVVAAESPGDVRVWDLDSGRELRHLSGVNCSSLAISGNARFAATQYYRQPVTIWDLENGRKLCSLGGKTSFSNLSMSEDGRRLVSSEWSSLHVWDIESGSKICTLEGHEHSIHGVSISGDGLLALSASEDHTLKVWDVESGQCLGTFTDDGGLFACAITPDQNTIVAGGTRCVMHFLKFER
jgi:WD40 repeat protein